MKKRRIPLGGQRLDVPGTGLLAAALIVGLILAVPHARAANDDASAPQDHVVLDKKFKGKLPITQLT
ncbi:MAG: hypothetical protein WAN72_11280, partial [Candidatus Acidiferrales bacterium]